MLGLGKYDITHNGSSMNGSKVDDNHTDNHIIHILAVNRGCVEQLREEVVLYTFMSVTQKGGYRGIRILPG